VSIQRPNTTTGRNRTRYAAAPSISGDGLKLNETAEDACDRISDSPITEPSAVPLVMAMVRLVSGGIVRRMACGSTTEPSVCAKVRPVERAASHWPFGTAVMPAQKISSANDISTRLRLAQVVPKVPGEKPSEGRPK